MVISADTDEIIAVESLSAGDFVNVFTGHGVRKASNSLGYEAHGYVLDNYSISDQALVYFEGNNDQVVNASIGVVFLGVNGGHIVDKGEGVIVQKIGVATTEENINFEPGPKTIRI